MTFLGMVAGQIGTAFAARTERASLRSDRRLQQPAAAVGHRLRARARRPLSTRRRSRRCSAPRRCRLDLLVRCARSRSSCGAPTSCAALRAPAPCGRRVKLPSTPRLSAAGRSERRPDVRAAESGEHASHAHARPRGRAAPVSDPIDRRRQWRCASQSSSASADRPRARRALGRPHARRRTRHAADRGERVHARAVASGRRAPRSRSTSSSASSAARLRRRCWVSAGATSCAAWHLHRLRARCTPSPKPRPPGSSSWGPPIGERWAARCSARSPRRCSTRLHAPCWWPPPGTRPPRTGGSRVIGVGFDDTPEAHVALAVAALSPRTLVRSSTSCGPRTWPRGRCRRHSRLPEPALLRGSAWRAGERLAEAAAPHAAASPSARRSPAAAPSPRSRNAAGGWTCWCSARAGYGPLARVLLGGVSRSWSATRPAP